MKVIIRKTECKRCGHKWIPRQAEIRRCPKCRNVWFDKKREDSKNVASR